MEADPKEHTDLLSAMHATSAHIRDHMIKLHVLMAGQQAWYPYPRPLRKGYNPMARQAAELSYKLLQRAGLIHRQPHRAYTQPQQLNTPKGFENKLAF